MVKINNSSAFGYGLAQRTAIEVYPEPLACRLGIAPDFGSRVIDKKMIGLEVTVKKPLVVCVSKS